MSRREKKDRYTNSKYHELLESRIKTVINALLVLHQNGYEEMWWTPLARPFFAKIKVILIAAKSLTIIHSRKMGTC